MKNIIESRVVVSVGVSNVVEADVKDPKDYEEGMDSFLKTFFWTIEVYSLVVVIGNFLKVDDFRIILKIFNNIVSGIRGIATGFINMVKVINIKNIINGMI